MKLRKIFFFTLIFTALVFCISCKGKKDPYADLDDDITNDESDTDTDTEQTDTTPDKDDSDDNGDTIDDTSDTENDADTDVNDNDIHGDSDQDFIDDDPQPQDEDHDTDDDEHGNDHDTDTDPEETGDEDFIPEAEEANVVCTGQNQCSNNSKLITCPASPNNDFFGQDAQYAKKGYCLMKSFTTTSDLVTDNISGLIWQRNLPGTYNGCTGSSGTVCTYQEAVNYCENLNYAGFSDWRLPTPEEFASIIDFGKTGPALDADIFPTQETPQRNFWTKTASLYSTTKSWYVDFTKGETREKDKTSYYFYARCVRGNELDQPSFTTIKDNTIIEDTVNNLLWTKPSTENLYWQTALTYCKNLDYNNETGWRLPNINELATLIDHSKTRPASGFPDIPGDSFWSSTSYEEYKYNAWSVNSNDGTIKTMDKTSPARVLCVK